MPWISLLFWIHRYSPSYTTQPWLDHPFTETDVASIDWKVADSLRLPMLFSHLRGKPATQGWEDTMLYNGYMPQRIGHRLFPGYALDKLAELREEHPHLTLKPLV